MQSTTVITRHVSFYSINNSLRKIVLLNQPQSLNEEVAKMENREGVHPVVVGWIAVAFSHHQHKPTAFKQQSITRFRKKKC